MGCENGLTPMIVAILMEESGVKPGSSICGLFFLYLPLPAYARVASAYGYSSSW